MLLRISFWSQSPCSASVHSASLVFVGVHWTTLSPILHRNRARVTFNNQIPNELILWSELQIVNFLASLNSLISLLRFFILGDWLWFLRRWLLLILIDFRLLRFDRICQTLVLLPSNSLNRNLLLGCHCILVLNRPMDRLPALLILIQLSSFAKIQLRLTRFLQSFAKSFC